ncbi:MAG TPA: hypothetical protein V6D23_15125 [Candidatus Obscuribacterales bacterium]
MTTQTDTRRIGEIIAASTAEFTAQVLQSPELDWSQVPPLGSLVRVDSESVKAQVLGIVCHVETTGLDGVHRPLALNLSRQQLREQQPQIFDLLTTRFEALTVGYIEAATYFQYYPAYPPQIHDFVQLCSDTEISRFTDRLFCLRTLLQHPASSDEVIAAFLRHSHRARKHQRDFLIAAGRQLSGLLKDNYDRLASILQRLE